MPSAHILTVLGQPVFSLATLELGIHSSGLYILPQQITEMYQIKIVELKHDTMDYKIAETLPILVPDNKTTDAQSLLNNEMTEAVPGALLYTSS